jgi:hypothetical protein
MAPQVLNPIDARTEAIANLPDGPELRDLAGLGTPHSERPEPTEERAAWARLARLIDEGGVDVAALSQTARGKSAWLNIAAQCADPGLLPAAMAAIDDPQQKAALVTQGSISRVRQLAAESVHDPEQLRELSKQVRDKDKNVYKILKQKLDLLHAKEREAAAIVDEINSICNALEKHGPRIFDPLYVGVFEHHHHRWIAMTAQADESQAARAAQAIARCQEVISEHARQISLLAEQEAAHRAAVEAQRLASEAAATEAATAAAARAAEEAQSMAASAATREAAEAARTAFLAAAEQVSRQIGGLLRKANSTLTGGQSQAAAGLRRAIDEKLASAAAAAIPLPNHLLKQVQQLDERLNELKQWKSFAVAPKRVELIRDMEALIGSTEEPKVLAERIKSLQEDWKTISKGIVSDDTEDWEKFHKASQTAYLPCREYFDAQAKLRQENAKLRQAVLDRVRAFESSLNPEALDWRMLATVMREAPLEWRSHSPIERDAARALQSEFDTTMSRLQATLDSWHERNVGEKRALIQQAAQLLTLEDGREAVDGVKRLQAHWKEVGPAPRDREQALWREFREHCDAVFQKRQQAHAEYTARLGASTGEAAALCEQIEQSAALTGAELAQATAKIPEWRAAFEALGELPRAEARGLQRRFELAIGHLEAQTAQQRARDAQQSITDVFEAARRIRAYEWAVMQDAEEAARQTLRQEAEAFLAGIKRGPPGSNQALKEVLAKSPVVTVEDLAAREKALRILCIRCEILRDAPTPSEDEVLRREYQVQRLMQGMGQGHTGAPDWNVMLAEWIRIAAIALPEHDSLQARFMRSWLENAAEVKRAAESKRATEFKRAAEPARRERHASRGRS